MSWSASTAPNLTLAGDAQVADDVTFGANVTVHSGTVIGAGCAIADNAVLGKQPTLSARSTAKRGPLPGAGRRRGLRDRRRSGAGRRLDLRRRLRGRRSGNRPRAVHDRPPGRDRPRCVCRERHHDRRLHQDPDQRLHHGVLHARGARLHRPLRRHHQRQLHGPHRAPARAGQGSRDPPRRTRSAAARPCFPGWRSARRRSSARAPSSSATCLRGCWWSAAPRASSVRSQPTSCSKTSRRYSAVAVDAAAAVGDLEADRVPAGQPAALVQHLHRMGAVVVGLRSAEAAAALRAHAPLSLSAADRDPRHDRSLARQACRSR